MRLKDEQRDFMLWERASLMAQARRRRDLRQLLLDLDQMLEKVGENPAAADAELELIDDPDVSALRAALQRSGHLLGGLDPRADISATILNRVALVASLTAHVRRFEETITGPYLRSAWPLPDLTSPALRRVLVAPKSTVNDCCFSPDGLLVMTTHATGEAFVWDARSGQAVRELPHELRQHTPSFLTGFSKGATACAFGPDDLAAVGHADGLVSIWNIWRGDSPLVTLDAGSEVVTAVGSPCGGRWLLTRHGGYGVRLWDWATGEPFLTVAGSNSGVIDGVMAPVTVSPDGRWLVVADEHGSVDVWGLECGKRHLVLTGHGARVTSVDVAETWLATADEVGEVRTWDLRDGRCRSVREGARGPLAILRGSDLLVYPTGRFAVAVVGPDGAAVLVRSAKRLGRGLGDALRLTDGVDRLRELVHDRLGAMDLPILAEVAADDSWMVTVTNHMGPGGAVAWAHAVHVHELPSGRLRHTEVLPDKCVSIVRGAGSASCATLTDSGDVRVWDPRTLAARHFVADLAGRPSAGAVSRQGDQIAVGATNGRVRIIDATLTPDAGSVITRADHLGEPAVAAIDPRGRWIATINLGRVIHVRDAANGEVRRTLRCQTLGVFHNGTGRIRLVGPDGAWLAATDDDGTVRVWNPTTGTQLSSHAGHNGELIAAASGPRAAWIAVAELDGAITVVDPGGGRAHGQPMGHTERVVGGAASPDGRLLVTATEAGDVRAWDPSSGALLYRLAGHARCPEIVFDPEGRWLATSDGASVQVWDPSDGARRHRLVRAQGTAVAASRDGRRFVTCGDDGSVQLWDPWDGHLVHSRAHVHEARVGSCSCDPFGRWLATTHDDGVLAVQSLGAGREAAVIAVDGALHGCDWFPASSRILATGQGGAYVFDWYPAGPAGQRARS